MRVCPLHAGIVYELFAFYFNLAHVSNAVVLWLGLRPADIFVYIFLPPLLMDSALRIDFFTLKKVCKHMRVLASCMPACGAGTCTHTCIWLVWC